MSEKVKSYNVFVELNGKIICIGKFSGTTMEVAIGKARRSPGMKNSRRYGKFTASEIHADPNAVSV